MSPFLHDGACPGETNQQPNPVHFDGGAVPPRNILFRPQTDPAEGHHSHPCPSLFPQACLLWMPMIPKVSQSPPLHPAYLRPLLLSQTHGVSFLSLQTKTAPSTTVRTLSLFTSSQTHTLFCANGPTQGRLTVHSDPGDSIGEGLKWVPEHPGIWNQP